MGQISAKFSKTAMEEMKRYYSDTLDNKPPYSLFKAKTPYASITAYHSGKVLFQGKQPDKEYNKWAKDSTGVNDKVKSNKTTSSHEFQPSTTLFQSSHIGSDESGTGDFFGPITTCAAYVPEERIALLKEIGIQDSKKITDDKIKELSNYIIEIGIPYSLMILHNEKYNQLQGQGWTQGKMKAMLHDSCIRNVLEKIGDAKYEGILIDQFCMPDIYQKHIRSEGKTLPNNSYFMTKAESYSIAVATASVIARASFIQEMEQLSDMVGMTLLKGASKKVDQTAASIIRKHGIGYLNKIAKVHFANTKKAKQLV